MDFNNYCHLEAFKNTPQSEFWLDFHAKKAAIIHCVHPLHSVPIHLSFIITLNKYNITPIAITPLTRRGLHLASNSRCLMSFGPLIKHSI
jgi:hypothetical protein